MASLEQLLELVRKSKHITAFTGAGVSTLSGIRDFRGVNGVYTKRWHGLQVEEILSIDCFEEHPEYFYEWAREFVYCLERYEPSIVHKVLAKMEAAGKLVSLTTQNIDLLHTKAGSKRVYEIHGSPATHHCRKCHAETTYAQISPIVLSGKVPHCEKCGGVIKPDIVFYGEGLDNDLMECAYDDMAKSDLLLVLGSSLTVQPAASLPYATLRGGGNMVIVNSQPTPLDSEAYMNFTDLNAVFSYLDRELFKK